MAPRGRSDIPSYGFAAGRVHTISVDCRSLLAQFQGSGVDSGGKAGGNGSVLNAGKSQLCGILNYNGEIVEDGRESSI